MTEIAEDQYRQDNKASKLRFYYIAFMTGIYTFWCCTRVIVGSWYHPRYREYVNRQMRLWSSKLLGLLNLKIKVIGQENFINPDNKPIIVMCNHASLYDIPISALALDTNLRMLAKKELFKIPVFAGALRSGEFLSIDRQNHDQAIKDLEKAKQKMKDGIVLWVAPEGTRSKDGRLRRFKKGGFHVAIDTGALVIPLVIKDIWKVQAGNDLTLYLNQQVEVEILPPIDAAQYSIENRAALSDTVRAAMLKALGQTDN